MARMKPLLTIAMICSITVVGLNLSRGANIVEDQRSPQTVVEYFVKLDTSGARLTVEGWRSADKLFTDPNESGRALQISVIASHFGLSKSNDNSGENQFFLGYEVIGKLDDQLRFTPIRPNGEIRNLKKFRVSATREDDKNRTGEWRIVGSQPLESLITPRSAIAYLTKMKERTSDATTKKNATKSLDALKPYAR